MPYTEEQLEEIFTGIAWTKPLPTTYGGGKEVLACRFCIAMIGLHGSDVNKLPKTQAEFAEHMKEKHGRKVKRGN